MAAVGRRYCITGMTSTLTNSSRSAFSKARKHAIDSFRRVVAIGFVSLGTLGFIVSLVWTGWPEVFRDEPPAPLFGKFVSQVLFVLAAGLGVYLVRAPTYRPDLGDTMRLMSNEPWSEELVRRRGRSWWTGDPRPPVSHDSHRINAG
jgi:hypothetical protein